MDSFAQLMGTMGAHQCGVDFVASLPVEIAELVLLKLDPRSLLNVARVSRSWIAVCKGSSRLRKTGRHHLRKQKRLMIQNDLIPTKQTKTQSTSRTTRMQTDMGISQPGSTSLVFKVPNPRALNSRPIDKKTVPRPSSKSTRSSLRLR